MLLQLLAFAPFLFQCLAIPVSHTVHEARDPQSVASRWTQKHRVASSALLPVRIGLTQSNLDTGDAMLMQVSDPDSPRYGKHWTSDEVIEYFKPSEDTVDAVTTWLRANGISKITLSGNKAWLAFDLTASKLEALLHAEYYLYEDKHTNAVVASCHQYHLPRSLQRHIDFITPGLKLLAPSKSMEKQVKKASQKSPPPGFSFGTQYCDQAITPDCLKALYHFTDSNITTPNPNNAIGLYEGSAQRWEQTDLNIFFANVTHGRIPKNTAPLNYAIDGGQSQTNHTLVSDGNGGEILLDIDLAYPIVYPQKVAIWDEDDLHIQHTEAYAQTTYWGFNQLLDSIDGSYCTYKAYGEKGDDPALDPKYPDPAPHGGFNGSLECGVFSPPYVLSVSYGGWEADVPMAYQARQCNEFMKLGLQGTSFLYASGDSGVSDYPAKDGGADTRTGCLGKNSGFKVYNPSWPNTCPYVTNVGGTMIHRGNNVQLPEVAVYKNDTENPELAFTSGGGFSNLYPMPAYQKAAVESYLENYNPAHPSYSALATIKPNPAKIDIDALQGNTSGVYNRIGRAYPDVSANGLNAVVALHGDIILEGGTSQSTPIFASLINRIVEERLAAGKTSLGFLNPAFYKRPSMLNDIVNGTNYGCGSTAFRASPGWDAVTGLGTPNYPKMLQYFMSLP